MPIQLDKILSDIAEERALHPNTEAAKNKKDQDDAWIKVGKKNKLSAHESKSIFKVLQKKYEQEKLKPSSTWKLFQQMEEICKKEEEPKLKKEHEESMENEEESFVEFLEVREEDDYYDGESDTQDKSMRSSSRTASPEKEVTNSVEIKQEPKLLNSQMMVTQAATTVKPDYTSAGQQQQQYKQSAFTKALQNKGISMRKTSGTPGLKQSLIQPTKSPRAQVEENMARQQLKQFEPADDKYVVMMPEGVKRKLQSFESREEGIPAKKSLLDTPSQVQIGQVEIKKEVLDEMEEIASRDGINVITIPSNSQTIVNELSNGITTTTTKTNGFNTPIDQLDFQKDIIFDNNPTRSSKQTNQSASPGEIINIGNFDNQLPPTFFKNLCNSNRHEALGLYVANVMNRVTGKTAVKLELNILKAVIEAQSDELARL